jgi:ATP adenylyltransferase
MSLLPMNESDPKTFVNLENARNEHQRKVMTDIEHNGDCPFCPENLELYHKNPILRKGAHWLLTTNQWPYDNTERHLLAISNKHAESLADLDPQAFSELQEHFVWAEDEFKIAAGGIAMRFGDTQRNGASVRHLHAHLIEPKSDLSTDQKVRFKIS